VLKGMQLYQHWHSTHPYPIYRAKVISEWAGSDEYAKILGGEYVTHAEAAGIRRGQSSSCPRCSMALAPNSACCPGCGERIAMGPAGCPTCRQPIDPSWAVCTACGTRLAGANPACACGTPIKPGWKFCQKCGTPS